jgi:hypothetical protein
MTFIASTLSEIDSTNSTTDILVGAAVYNGTSRITTGYNSIDLTISSDQNSSAGGIKVLISDDGTTFTTYLSDTYFSGTFYTKNIKILKRYYKIQYINGSETQTSFSLSSRLNTADPGLNTNTSTVYTTISDPMNDAFGKLRVSNPYTLLDLKLPAYTGTTEFETNNISLCYSTTGNYTNTPNFAFTTLSGTGSGYQINQSRKYSNYQPGKSLLFLASAVIYATGPNTPTATSDYKNRVGYFDDKNGLFFEYDSKDEIGIVVRNNSVDVRINQADWNVDKLDGSGVSGYDLEFTNTQLFVIDFEWLGVGRIRFGFYIYGIIYYCHQVTNVNTLTSPYMRTANLPIRYEIRGNNPAQTNTVSMRQICSSVISEGGYNPLGYSFSISNNITPIENITTTETPLLVLLGNTSYNYYHEPIIPTEFSVIETSNANVILQYIVRLYLAPNSPGTLGTLINVNNNSKAAYTTTVTGYTTANSIIVDQGYFQGKGSIFLQNLSSIFTSITQITSNVENTSDIIVLAVRTLSGTANCVASMNFKEAY